MSNHSKSGKLKGLLVTPNIFATIDEYISLCEFAKSVGAKYVLMNPLSKYGRGKGNVKYAYSDQQMIALKEATKNLSDDKIEIVFIRFPNVDKKPLSPCYLKSIPYIYSNGDVTVCPYLSFTSERNTKRSFIACDAFAPGVDIGESVKSYKLPFDLDTICASCKNKECGKGCIAARIAKNEAINGPDKELCPLCSQ